MISKQIAPSLLMFGWYILVVNKTFGGLNGYSAGKLIVKKKSPPSYGVPYGPVKVASHLKMS